MEERRKDSEMLQRHKQIKTATSSSISIKGVYALVETARHKRKRKHKNIKTLRSSYANVFAAIMSIGTWLA